jgi:cytochrome c peroxidase
MVPSLRRGEAAFAAALASLLLAAPSAAQDVVGEFPHVKVPAENPQTPEKISLGKALFHEEQLSSDDTMACATCHRTEFGGGDPRESGRHPGNDGYLRTADDEFGSLGVVLRAASGEVKRHRVFGEQPQVTPRATPTVIGAAFFNVQFGDTRALPTFCDERGEVVIRQFASLESQAVGPLMSSVEMAKEGRTWAELTAKLAAAKPLALASDLPPALAEFVGEAPDYTVLFQKAFGSPEVTRERIAMAIASYERTLVPDQTPFDLGTLTEVQERGLEVFVEHDNCELCHPSANKLFSDGARRDISLPGHERPVKVPTLRNVGLRSRFMSSGQFTSLKQVIDHYQKEGLSHLKGDEDRDALIDFVANGLTDPRVEKRLPPFDRPTLRSERVEKAAAEAARQD